MDSGHLASRQLSEFDGSTDKGPPGSGFFFSCLQHREITATLRYGIEARKGLILCTGDAGTGKSTLLNKLERELGSDVTYLVISDPYLSFTEIVRRISRSLGSDTAPDNELGSLDRCQQLLRSQLATGRITAVAFDDAQHLRDDILEQLLQSVIGIDASDRDRNLAQVILTSRPELKERLFQPRLRSLGSVVALECRLQPLNENEIVDYIQQRLRAADMPEELFERNALQRIANFSGGNFRRANALCDRALATAQSSSRKQISSEIVDGAAKDLDLWQPQWVRKENSKTTPPTVQQPLSAPQDTPNALRERLTAPPEHHELFRFQFADDGSAETADNTFLNYFGANGSRRFGSRGGRQLFIGSLVILALVAIAGVWIYSDVAKQVGAALGAKLEDIAGVGKSPSPTTETIPITPYGLPRQSMSPLPRADSPSAFPDDPQTTVTPPPTFEEPVLPPPPEPLPTDPPAEAKKLAPPPAPVRVSPETPKKPPADLTTEVFKAIQNRAIRGVRVSISDNIVYLDGRVASERQRRAAESAVRDVPGVRAVRNRLTVE